MSLQSAKNQTVDFLVEGTFNTAPGTSGATRLRFTPSAGLTLKAATIRSEEQRADALQTMGRNGSLHVEGSYGAEASVGSHDVIYEAVMRSTWAAAAAITVDGGAALTSFEVLSTSTFQFAGTTTPHAAGLRVGDVFRFTNMSTAANNSINVRVKSISSSVVTVHGTPLTVQGADTAATLTIAKKLKNPSTPTKRTFYIEQRDVDLDSSQVFGGCRFTGFKLTGTPDGQAKLEFPVLGASMATLTGGSSPYYGTPTEYTSVPLVFADAKISVNGTDIAIATAFELTYQINAATQPVIGSQTSPDVFDNDVSMTGSFSMIRQDYTNVAAFVAETEFELHILLTEPESEPKDFISIYVPRIKFTGADAPLGGDGAKIETLPFQTGAKGAATNYDATLLTICTSAA